MLGHQGLAFTFLPKSFPDIKNGITWALSSILPNQSLLETSEQLSSFMERNIKLIWEIPQSSKPFAFFDTEKQEKENTSGFVKHAVDATSGLVEH